MDDVELSRYAAEAFRHMDRAPHPSIEEMAEFATGELAVSTGSEIESHLAGCNLCRGRMEEHREFVADSEERPGKDLSREWTALRRRIQWHKATSRVIRWRAAAAADIAAVAGIAWLLIGLLMPPSTTQLLAQAYQEQRPFDVRLAGAGYAEVRRQRGGGESVFGSPAPLLKAQARLAEQVKSSPDDPEILRLQAEADMMSGHARAAVETLERARDLKPDEPSILADLGAGYCLRGELEKQFGDYESAIDCLGQSLHLKPGVREVVFNLALALEKHMLKDQAVEQWEEYLKLDGSGGWADEARRHLSDLKAAIQSRENALHQIVDDPGQFLTLVAAGNPVDAEAYLREVVIRKWLPLAASDGTAREAIVKLAQVLKVRHGDTWLADMVSSGSGTEMQSGLKKLAAARSGNLSGSDLEAALISAREAEQNFLRGGSPPGNLWARFEEASSLHGLLRHDDCVAVADALMRDLDPHRYAWLRAQVRIESAICLMRLARLSEASDRLREARDMGHAAGLGSTELRASVQYIDCVGHTGLPSETYSIAEECLSTFWNGTYPALFFQQVVGKLLDIATRSNQKYASWLLARSGAWAADEASNPYAQAPAHANLAAAAQHIGRRKEARSNLEIADELFAKTTAGYRVQPEISLASVELEGGDPEAAMTRLGRLSANLPSVLIETQYYSVLGEAYRQKGWLPSAIDAFHKSIDIGKQRIASVSSERDKTGVLKAVEPSYRGLIAAMLDSSAPASAVREWRSFRALDAAGDPGSTQPPDSAAISFVELSDHYVCWLTRQGQVIPDHLSISNQPLGDVVRRFLRECSDPAGNRLRLWADAQQLYQWIASPLLTHLTEEDKNIILELDGTLASVPMQALVSAEGRYFGDRFSVLISTGYSMSREMAVTGRKANVLVVANPQVTGDHADQFPPLPETLVEAEAVRAVFPASTILEGPHATLDAFKRHLPDADVVHFAGHGYSGSGNGGLLFAARSPGEDYQLLVSADLRGQEWSRCRLAVLSACAVAKGETRGPHNPDSLVRALTKAGVARVLASLWSVDSAATGQLMRVFYASLAQGIGPADALRIAQQWVRQQPGWEHPYYWAGFQLYGTV